MLAVLEINDAALAIGTAAGEFYSEPGYARLTADGIEFGEAARARAWTDPQTSFNQYWQQLGETPLLLKSPWARHFADIAFAQLRQLLAAAGNPRRCLLAVPGSLSNARLSLLLGMFDALEVAVVAVVDSAVAANLHGGESAVHLDLQLHEALVTTLDVAAGELVVRERKVIPEMGIVRLHNQLARAVADQLIRTIRFDPLHDPATEQWLFDQIPRWLAQLCWQDEVNSVIDTPAGERPLRLTREMAAAQLEGRLSALDGFLRQYDSLPLVLSHAGSFLPALGRWPGARILGPATVVKNCLELLAPGLPAGDELRRLTAAPLAGDSAAAPPRDSAPLFLLYRHRALSLARPVSVVVTESGLSLSAGIDHGAAAVLVQRENALELLHGDDGVRLPALAAPGETVDVLGHQLTLVEVNLG